jgi:hypothetical protein
VTSDARFCSHCCQRRIDPAMEQIPVAANWRTAGARSAATSSRQRIRGSRFESIERRQRTCQPRPCSPVAETDSCRRSSLSLTFPICPHRWHSVTVSIRS